MTNSSTHQFVRKLGDQGFTLCERCGISQTFGDKHSCDERMQLLEQHASPVLAGHATDGTPCWCEPTTEVIDGIEVSVHRDPAKAS